MHLPGVTSSSWSGSAGSIAASVAVIERLARRAATRAARIRRRLGVELGEHVVEQEQRRDAAALGDQLRLGEQEREHGEPLLALRAEAPQLARAGGDDDVVEVRAEAGDAALEVAVEPRVERRRPSAARPS